MHFFPFSSLLKQNTEISTFVCIAQHRPHPRNIVMAAAKQECDNQMDVLFCLFKTSCLLKYREKENQPFLIRFYIQRFWKKNFLRIVLCFIR